MSTQPISLFVHGTESDMTENQIKSIVIASFKEYGQIDITEEDIKTVIDRERGTGFRRFCFVMVDPEIATQVVENFEKSNQDDADFPLVVNIAKPKEDRGPRSNSGSYNRRDRGDRGDSYSRNDSYSSNNSRRDW